MTTTFLVTGGFGYVGGRIAQALVAAGFHVRIGTRRSDAKAPWLPSAQVTVMNWASVASLASACVGVDVVVHCAAMNEIDAVRDPVGAIEVNVANTARLIEAAVSGGVGRFVYFSTAHIYGPLRGTIAETTLPRPRNPYATTHRAAEDQVLTAHAKADLVGMVLRLSNSFGAPTHLSIDRWSLLINDLCRLAARHQNLVLRSPGLDRRDFIPLEDVAKVVVHLSQCASARIGDGIFNVGGRWAPTVLEVAELIAERSARVVGFRPEIERPVPPPDAVSAPLDFCIDKLEATGFRLSGDAITEIDATLSKCMEEA